MPAAKKQFVYEKQADIAKAIAHPLRIAIIEFLSKGPQCVCDIARHVGSERSNVSQHLTLMTNAGVLQYQKQGLKVIYKIKAKCVLKFLSCLAEAVKQQAVENQKLLKAIK